MKKMNRNKVKVSDLIDADQKTVMTKKELLDIFQAINQMGNLTGVKFSYGISKNHNLLKPEVEALNKAIEPSEAFQEYEKLRIALAEKHAKKGDDGNAVIVGNEYILQDPEAFKKEFEALKEDHKETLDKREQQFKDYNELLKEEIEVSFYKVKVEDVPQNITLAQMNAVLPMVVE